MIVLFEMQLSRICRAKYIDFSMKTVTLFLCLELVGVYYYDETMFAMLLYLLIFNQIISENPILATNKELYLRSELCDWQDGSRALENQSNQIRPLRGRVPISAIKNWLLIKKILWTKQIHFMNNQDTLECKINL